MAEASLGGVVQLASANTALISCRDAKNKRVGVFAVQGDGFGGDAADGVPEMRRIILCAV